MKAKRKSDRSRRAKTVTIGREAFARFSEVEGIKDTEESQRMFAEFDRQELTPTQRRKAILQKHRKAQAH